MPLRHPGSIGAERRPGISRRNRIRPRAPEPNEDRGCRTRTGALRPRRRGASSAPMDNSTPMDEPRPTLSSDEHRDALAARLFGSLVATMDLAADYLGDRLSLHRVLSDGGTLIADDTSAR